MNKNKQIEFAEELTIISNAIGFKLSSRGWCYQLEHKGKITKAEFDKVERQINECRKSGILPIDFVAEEESRGFSGVVIPDDDTPIEDLRYWIENTMSTEERYIPNWWEGERFYIQMVVEKIDLKTLFEPVCKKYKIPIATSKGWSSLLQRAIYSQRFKRAEEQGLKPVLLYCGDFDPDGLRISDFLRKNLEDLKNIWWEDGTGGYDPTNLEIVRFGLNHDFIEKHKLTWIPNLITGSGGNLASLSHKNHHMPYVQEYMKKFGVKKCEANAIVVIPQVARELCDDTIKSFLGKDAHERFLAKRQVVRNEVQAFRKRTNLDRALKKALELIDRGKMR